MKKSLTGMVALGAASLLALTACATDGGTGEAGDNNGNGSENTGPISVAYVAGWTDGQSIAYLLEDQLGKLGYEVDVTDMADNGPLYAGLAQGDLDISASAWPEVTQKSFWDQFGESIEDLSTWYDGAVLTIAVPEYSSLTSLEDLAGNADLLNGEIVGIEPGAGLTGVTQDSMMPAYGLEDDFTLLTSSTATMLTVLGEAMENEEEIAVTLWRPFWAYSAYDVRDLEDPLGAMGEPEGLHVLARDGFTADFPELAEFISALKLNDDAYGALEALITSDEFEGDSEGAVDQWISENAEAFPGLIVE